MTRNRSALIGTVQAPRAEIVFVESDVANYQSLIDGFDKGTEIHVLDASQDGLARMAQILKGRDGIDAIRIISHGAEAALHLGAMNLTAHNLPAHAAELATIGGALKPGADILLYGCNVAAGSDGAAFIAALAQATHADIAASTDNTGSSARGGNWILESQTGPIESLIALNTAEAYNGLLIFSNPTIAITTSDNALIIGETATITFTLSASSSNFTAADVSVTGGTLSDFAGSGTVYTATFTPTPNSTTPGTVNVAGATFTNVTGDPNDAATQLNLSVDTLAPTVVITTSDDNLTYGETATLTFTLSEASVSFTAADPSVTGGVLSGWAGSGTVYTATFTPTPNSTTPGTVNVAENKFTDAAGNPNGAATELGLSVNTIPPPIIFITTSDNALTFGETATLTFTLSAASTNFTASDITVTGGTLCGFTASSGTVYTATFTPTANSTTPGTVNVAGGAFTNAASINNTAANQLNLSVDTIKPSVVITTNDSNLTQGETATLTFTLSEASTNFGAGDISATGGTLSGWAGSGTVYTATFTPTPNSSTAAAINVEAGAFTDAAGNPNVAATQLDLGVNTAAPTIAITSSAATLNSGQVATLIFTLSAASTDFGAGDISVAGGALSGFTAISSTVYLATFTPTPATTTAGTVDVASGSFTTAGGNNTAATQLNLSIDTNVPPAPAAPTVAINTSDSTLTIGETATLIFTLSEASVNFADSDISVAGGTLSGFTAISGTIYYATFTPTANSATPGTVNVASGSFTNGGGDSNTAATQLNLSIDTLAPTVAITTDDSNLTTGESAILTFTLSEASVNFTSADVSVSGGTLSEFAGSGTVYNAAFTPTANSSTAATVDVAAGKFTDAAGNPNTAATQLNLGVDTVVHAIVISSDVAVSGDAGTASMNFTVTTDVAGVGCWAIQLAGSNAPANGTDLCAISANSSTVLDYNTNLTLNEGSATPFSTTVALTPATNYKLYFAATKGCDCTGIQTLAFTTAAAAAPTSTPTVVYYPPTPPANEIPTGGGTATLTGGQNVTVSDNGKDGTLINLPPPSATSSAGNNNVTLPGTGQISVSSDSDGTQLGVQSITMPGATSSVSTVMVSQGSASFTATKEGQPVASLKNGIFVVSGTTSSKVTVDATGADTKIGIQSSDTIVVPTGSINVAGTSVDLPSPSPFGDASTVSVKIGTETLTIQSSQADTKMTFKVVDIGGVQTPVLAVTGSAQVSGSGDNQPIVSIAGNVIRTGKSGGGSQVCNTVVQASSNSTSDTVHVVTCYIVLDAGSFSALSGGNNFAALKDGIVWAGETAEFDKNGKVTSAYLGSRPGDTDAVGDDLLPGGNKFTGAGYQVGAFIPRLAGAPLRLNGAKLDDSISNVFSKALGADVQLASPSQGRQGVLNFTISGDVTQAQTVLAYTLSGDTVCMLPSKRIRVDTSRADGLSFGAEGEIEVSTGGLVTIFVPSVSDPSRFADRLTELVPGSNNALRWNGTWRITGANGTMYVGRPQWSYRAAQPGAETFGTTVEGNISYNDNGRSQLLFPDFYDYDTLKATFRTELNDPALSVQPRMDGTALAVIKGKNYILAPQWNVVQLPDSAAKPAWWEDNGVLYIKNADGSVQGFTVK